jgi:hypothetical protein
MKRSNAAVRCIIAMLISVAAVAFAHAAFAATVTGGLCSYAKPTRAAVTDSGPLLSEMQTASNRWLLTLFIEAPAGNTFQLVYFPTEGWKFVSQPIEAALIPIAMPSPNESSVVEEPLAVFIDGPTGATFVWMHDAGWEFVGCVTDRKR